MSSLQFKLRLDFKISSYIAQGPVLYQQTDEDKAITQLIIYTLIS